MLAQLDLNDCLSEFPPINSRGTKLNSLAPYRRVASAVDGDPREPTARGDIFTVGDSEYLVPEERGHKAGTLVTNVIRLDQARKIVSRPNGTRQISEMTLTTNIQDSVRAVLAKAVEEYNPPHHGYSVQVISPSL